MKRILTVLSLVMTLTLAACGAATPLPSQPAPTLTPEPSTPLPAPTATATPASAPLLTYHDPAARFSFDYPAGWSLNSTAFGSRASGVQLTSWTPVAGQTQDVTPPGGTRLDVMVQLWDPKGDLVAYSAQRRSAWEGSLSTIVSAADLTLSDGRAAKEFVVQGPAGDAPGYVLLTTLGQDYLVFSGTGDMALLRQIAHSAR